MHYGAALLSVSKARTGPVVQRRAAADKYSYCSWTSSDHGAVPHAARHKIHDRPPHGTTSPASMQGCKPGRAAGPQLALLFTALASEYPTE